MRKALPVAVPSLLVFVLLSGQATAQQARDWLERMNRAVEELNYRGTFVHVLDGTPETLHIVHRHADGQSGERILSLDGARREIVRQAAPPLAVPCPPPAVPVLGGKPRTRSDLADSARRD